MSCDPNGSIFQKDTLFVLFYEENTKLQLGTGLTWQSNA